MTEKELVAEIKRIGALPSRGNYVGYLKLKQELIEVRHRKSQINMTEHEKIDVSIDIGTKYHRAITGSLLRQQKEKATVQVDIYDVLKAFEITCPARQHALKKLLLAGGRGSKSERTDLEEAHNSIKRAIELL